MKRPPPPYGVFPCCICGDKELRGRTAVFDEQGRAFCHDCVGRLPEEDR